MKGRDFCLRVATDTGQLLNANQYVDIAYAPLMNELMRSGNWWSRSGVRQNLTL